MPRRRGANGVSQMPKFKVTFHEVIQDSQVIGNNDDHMVSRLFFSLEVDGKRLHWVENRRMKFSVCTIRPASGL
jgi:hypothetical protein